MITSIFLNYLILLIFILMSIAFFTIMERKILGIFHIRLGPNKTGIFGIFQPFSDVLKLFSKVMFKLVKINNMIWNFSPIMILMILMLTVNMIPMKMENNLFMMNLLFLIFIICLPIFFFLFSSFFSFSKYSIISSKRMITQMLSYEMAMMFILILMMPILFKSNLYNILMMMELISQSKMFLVLIMFLVILAESSRIPFDFVESESELISGFNTEFSGSYFSLFFVFEYGMMMFFSILISMIFFFFFFFFFLVFFFIFIRCSFPRMRYDQMMLFFWKFLFPILMSFMIFKKML